MVSIVHVEECESYSKHKLEMKKWKVGVKKKKKLRNEILKVVKAQDDAMWQ